VLEASTQTSLEALLEMRVTGALGLTQELMLRLPAAELKRAVKHTAVPLMKDAGLDVAELLASGMTSAAPGADEGPEEGGAASAAPGASKEAEEGHTQGEGGGNGGNGASGTSDGNDEEPQGIDFSKLQGVKQLENPSTLNMARLRMALLPGASAHGTAHGLAQLYSALGAGKLVPSALLSQAQQLSVAGKGAAGEPVRFGLGFQVGSCVEVAKVQGIEVGALVGPLDKFVKDRTRPVLGHAAVGGTLGFCVPDRKVALAVTVSKLTPNKVAVKKIVELMMGEVGLGAPSGFW